MVKSRQILLPKRGAMSNMKILWLFGLLALPSAFAQQVLDRGGKNKNNIYDSDDDDWARWEDFDPEVEGKKTEMGDRPNIIFAFVDDAGWNDVGFHNPEVMTPIIDMLAANGITLEQNYVAYYCTPSRAALMTGMEPFHIGRQKFVFRPSSLSGVTLEKKFLPEYLKDLGYNNHIVGKWHLGHCNSAYVPMSRGFDSQYGPMASGVWNFPKINYGPPFLYDWFNNGTIDRQVNFGLPTFQMEMYEDRAIEIIENNAAAGKDPFFMYLAFTSTHFPIEAPVKYLDMYPDVDDTYLRRSFYAMTTQLDDVMGNIVQALKDTDQYDNTIIVLMPDNGAYSMKWDWVPFYGGGDNQPLRGQKGTNYEGGTRVYGLVHYPGMRTSGVVSNKIVHVTDWLPTLLRAAGGRDVAKDYPELEDIDGIDQYDVIFDGKDAVRQAFTYNILRLHIDDGQGNEVDFDMGAIRYGKWKLLNFRDTSPLLPLGTFELYDLFDDPNETNDMFASEPEVAAKMVEKFQEAAATQVPSDPIAWLPDNLLKLCQTDHGEQYTDFCDLEGNPKMWMEGY